MSDEKKMPTDQTAPVSEELAKARQELDSRMKEMEKEFDTRREQLEAEYEEKKAALHRDFNATKIMAEDELKQIRSEAQSHKAEIICGVSIAAAVSILTAVLCAHFGRDRR